MLHDGNVRKVGSRHILFSFAFDIQVIELMQPASYPRIPGVSVVFTDWLSRTAALGSAFLPSVVRSSVRKIALIRSHASDNLNAANKRWRSRSHGIFDLESKSIFVITAFDLIGKPLMAHKRRMKK